jgi:hypothetical protein
MSRDDEETEINSVLQMPEISPADFGRAPYALLKMEFGEQQGPCVSASSTSLVQIPRLLLGYQSIGVPDYWGVRLVLRA